MPLLVIIEIVLSVVFASGMMLYLGIHFLKNEQTEICDNSGVVTASAQNDKPDSATSLKEKSYIRFNKDSIFLALENLKTRKLLWLFVVMLTLSLGVWFYDMLYLEMPMLKSYVNSVIFMLVATMGYIDFKEHIIPNPLVLIGLVIWVISFILEVFAGGVPWRDSLTFSLMGFAVCGGILLVLAIVLRSGLGMGDVKMYAMFGLIYGLTNTYSLLICTVIPMAIVAIILLASKKVTKKSTLPMAPFTVFAYIVGILCGM